MDNGFSRESLKTYAGQSRGEFEKALGELVEIPTISSDSNYKSDMKRGAEYAISLIESFGGKASLYDTPGHPLVHGRFDRGEGLPTVTVYNHLDVQPAETPDWKTPSFQFVKQGDRYFGRGTTDDKGPAMTALFGARYAFDNGAPVNIHFLWEMEEEIGSPHFEETIRGHAREFATDSVLVVDTIWVSRSRPAQPAGLRGLQGFRFTLRTGETDQHSGTAGGAARNPVTEMCQLISECVDGKTGRVKIPGFYSDVVPPTKKDLEDLKSCGFTVRDFKKDHLYKKLRVERFAFGKEPVFVREGGSIGAVLSMEKVLKKPIFFLGLSLPEHGYHAPNENYDWEQAAGGMAAFAKYFNEVGSLRATTR